MSPAEGRRQRAALMRDIARDLKAKDRAKLGALRGRVRSLAAEARAARLEAVARCRAGRRLPTLKSIAAELRAAKAAARSQCDVDLRSARALKDAAARARFEAAAEAKYQSDLRRIEAGHKRKLASEKKRRPGLARTSSGQETDEEVRGNIPAELVALWDRVKRGIKGSDRISRTEVFLQYAEEHPDEEWLALESSVDRAIAEMEKRQAMPNPKNPPRLTAAQSRKRFEALKKAGCKPKRVRLGGESVVIRRKACKASPLERTARNPRRPPKKWWDRCLRSVAARKYAADPPAVCGAAWYRMPPYRREAIVRRLERGGPRERCAAVALAKAERRHAEGPPRKRNGAMGDADAAREYERTHWGQAGRGRVLRAGAANPAHGTAVALGRLKAVEYETIKGKHKRVAIYVHDFEGSRPTLLYNEGGLVIAGGQYVVSEHGIEG